MTGLRSLAQIEYDLCMVETYFLELEIWGSPMSPSVAEYVRRLDESRRLQAAAQFGGSRALSELVGVRV